MEEALKEEDDDWDIGALLLPVRDLEPDINFSRAALARCLRSLSISTFAFFGSLGEAVSDDWRWSEVAGCCLEGTLLPSSFLFSCCFAHALDIGSGGFWF